MKQAANCLQPIWRAAGVRRDKLQMKAIAHKRTPTRGASDMIPVSPRGMQPQLRQMKVAVHLSGRCRWQRDYNASIAAYPPLSPFGAAGLVLEREPRLEFAHQPLVDAGESFQKQDRDAIILLLHVHQDYTSCVDKASIRTKISMTGPFDCSLAYLQPTRLGRTGH